MGRAGRLFHARARCGQASGLEPEGLHPRAPVTAKDARLLDLGRSMAAYRVRQDPEIRIARRVRARRSSRGAHLSRSRLRARRSNPSRKAARALPRLPIEGEMAPWPMNRTIRSKRRA